MYILYIILTVFINLFIFFKFVGTRTIVFINETRINVNKNNNNNNNNINNNLYLRKCCPLCPPVVITRHPLVVIYPISFCCN